MDRQAGASPNNRTETKEMAAVKAITAGSGAAFSPSITGFGQKVLNLLRTPDGQSDSQKTAGGSQQGAFGKSLSDQSGARCPQCEPHGDFPLPGRSPRQQQVGHVGTCRQQHKSHRRHQDDERFAEKVAEHREAHAGVVHFDVLVHAHLAKSQVGVVPVMRFQVVLHYRIDGRLQVLP